jgi:hypothetical protein
MTTRATKSPADFSPAKLAGLADEALLEAVQRRTFRFFWDAAEPHSGLARDRICRDGPPANDLVASGGSGFGVMAIIVAVERGWVTRGAALERLERALQVLTTATCFHGAFPHFLNGKSGATIPFTRKDDGGDLVETSLLLMGLLCVREYFDRKDPQEARIRGLVQWLWHDVEWNWYTRDGRPVLYWHWSATNGWALDLDIRGSNECLITYLLAAAAPRNAIAPEVYHRGYAGGREFLNGKAYYGIELPLGAPYGGPLYFAHYTYCALDPRGLKDRYADYWQQNLNHVRINHAHCLANPRGHRGYGAACWGLTSSDDVDGYSQHAPDHDTGTISPTAALSSMPYAPREALAAMRHFLSTHGEKVWGPYGFVDAFCEARDWYADTHLAIDQGPIILMIENFRSGLLWNLFMRAPEIRAGLAALSFLSPHLETAAVR